MAAIHTNREQSVDRIPVQRGGAERNVSYQRMWLRTERPEPYVVRVFVHGDLDALTAARLEDVLGDRLRSQIQELTVDLSGVDFLGVAGLEVLRKTTLWASVRGIDLSIAAGERRAVRRALAVTGFDQDLPVEVT